MTADQPNVAWCTRAQVKALPVFDDLTKVDPNVLDQMCLVASTWLWRATGRQFPGGATATVRPVSRWLQRPLAHLNGSDAVQYFDSRGGRVGWPWAWYSRGEYAFEVELGHSPIRTVSQVVIDGTIFDPTKYRVDDARWLVRTDGQSWPFWQDWTKPSGPAAQPDQTSTWEVTFSYGTDPPADGVLAATVLAGELAMALAEPSKCRLPGNLQSMTRQGESMLFVDPLTLTAANRWGLREVDMFTEAMNPNHLTQPSSVLSPDIPRAVRRVGTLPGS